jgi:hypothetical protein
MLVSDPADLKGSHNSRENMTFDTSESVPFASEEALVQVFSNHETLNPRKLFGHVYELDAGNGIADVGIYELRQDCHKYTGLLSIKPQWTYPLIRLPYRKVFQVNDIETLACVTKKTARKIVNTYSSAGYCKKTSNGWIKIFQPRPPVNKIYAIEAKLRDWRKALYQASRYRDFANQSWVLLDHHYSKAAIKNTDEFTKRSIGLASIEKDGNLMVHVYPKVSKPKSEYRYWYAANIILKSYLTEIVSIEPI